MKVLFWLVVLSVLVAVGLSAQPCAATEYPNVASLTPFVSESMYMSLPGYLRFLVFQDQGVWITRAEAVEVVKQQGGRI